MNFLSKQRILGVIVLIALIAIGISILLQRSKTNMPIPATQASLPVAKLPVVTNVFEQNNPSQDNRVILPNQSMTSSTIPSTQSALTTRINPPDRSSTNLSNKELVTPAATSTIAIPNTNAGAATLLPAVHHALINTPLAPATVKPASIATTHQWQAQHNFIATNDWLVQVGSFKSLSEANRLAVKLRAKGFKTTLQKIHTTAHGEMIRIVVGKAGLTHTAAIQLRLHLIQQMHLTGFLTHQHLSKDKAVAKV